MFQRLFVITNEHNFLDHIGTPAALPLLALEIKFKFSVFFHKCAKHLLIQYHPKHVR
jgi:hypothetical protein